MGRNFLDIYEFGTKGDGIHDDTFALQKALNESSQSGLALYFSPGIFSVGELIVPPETVLIGEPKWGFSSEKIGNTVLKQRFENQECVLDVSGASGSTINGMSVQGLGKGRACNGILSRKPDPGKHEDAYRIERTKVSGFTDHAVKLMNVWCFSIRHSMFAFSGGDGLHMQGYDGFISDNWFSGNRGCGFGTEDTNCSVTMTGNRIEWNGNGGIVVRGGSQYNITGNYIDRSGKEGIALIPGNEKGRSIFCNTISCAGNVIYRSGKSAGSENSAHIRMEKCVGVTVENCTVWRVSRWGIAVGYTYQHQKFSGVELDEETFRKYGHENIIIRNCYVSQAGGDAITPMYSLEPLTEHNIADSCAKEMNDSVYRHPEDRMGKVAAAIWPWKCKNARFCYNEVTDTRLNQDGMAYDADSGDGTLYEYNYSRSNEGGCIMFCMEEAVHNIFRKNISYDDLGGLISPACNPDALVTENEFHMRREVPLIRESMQDGTVTLKNNKIIILNGE